MDTDEHESSFIDEPSDNEGDWEEVPLAAASVSSDATSASVAPVYDPYASVALEEPGASENAIEITIEPRKGDGQASRPKGLSHAERLVRIDIHKIHTVTLLCNALVRNKWLNDQLLHARLMSLTPLVLQNAFAMIHKSRVPDAHKRGRLFEAAVQRLVDWWLDFFEVVPEGHLRNRTFDEVAAQLREKEAERARRAAARAADKKGKGKQRAQETDEDSDDEEDNAEVVRSEKSLMKHALMQRGSRDTSAQLFTALCRALGVPARLVVSLQSVPWQTSVGKPKPPAKKKKKPDEKAAGQHTASAPTSDGHESAAGVADVKGKGKARDFGFPGDGLRLDGGSTASGTDTPARVIKLRKSRPAGQKLGSSSSSSAAKTLRAPDPLTSAPVFWTEVFSRADGRWLPVDPLRGTVNKRKTFDPTVDITVGPGPRLKQENRLVYVIAVEEDGYGRDVTPRYAKDYGAKVAKVQGAQRAGGSKARKEWWDRVCALIHRPYRLHRDDIEDDELQVNQLTEAMPTTMAGFKDHPLYALERHLRRDEVIHPLRELGKFRGEPVYPRANVLVLKTAENWMRSGRKVQEGCQPMKWVKQRAVTVNRKRELELARGDPDGFGDDNADGVMQGLYALGQTEVYTPPPVVDGRIPKNNFGNIDLYVPSMLPAGAVHVPHKGAAKIARQLGFEFAEAVTGFEFKKRKATPVTKGIVIAAENETALLEAYWEAEHDAAEKEMEKRRERVLKRWTRLVQGLRIRQRLQAQYAGDMPKETTVTVDVSAEAQDAGGFLVAADDVVQPYTLPRYQHAQVDVETGPSRLSAADMSPTKSVGSEAARDIRQLSLYIDEEGPPADADGDAEMLELVTTSHSDANVPVGAPKTMEEMARRAARARQASEESLSPEDNSDEEPVQAASRPKPLAQPAAEGSNRRSTRTTQASAKVEARGVVSSTATSTRRASARQVGRKRARYAEDEEEASDGDDGVAEAVSTRRRTRTQATAASVKAPATRVLRARRPKANTQLSEDDSDDA